MSGQEALTAESVTLRCFVSQPEVPLGQEFDFTVEVEWDVSAGEYDFVWPEPPACDKLETVGNSSSSQRRVVGGRTLACKRFVYRLKPIVTGKAVIEPVKVEYQHKPTGTTRTERTRFIELEIIPARKGGWDLTWLTGVLVLLGVAGAAVVFFVFVKAWPRTIPSPSAPVREPEPEETALARVREYEKMRMEGDVKEYCIAVSRLLKQFIEDKYKIAVKNLLTGEVLDRLRRAQVPDQVCVRMKSIFELSDAVKYSTGQPDAGEAERLKTMLVDLMQGLK